MRGATEEGPTSKKIQACNRGERLTVAQWVNGLGKKIVVGGN